jgi:putative lipoic acid-binding regulatory protein
MRDISIDDLKAEGGKGFEFPGEHDITAIGNASAELTVKVPEILIRVGVRVDHETVRYRATDKGNYASVTVSAFYETREQYDAARKALHDDPDIRTTL